MTEALLGIAAAVHAFSAAVLAANLAYLRRRKPGAPGTPRGRLSVCIPARNEATVLPGLLADLASQDHPDFEVIVVDDDSTDGTGDAVLAAADPRFAVIRLDGPPDGWLGKPHALHRASERARGDRFLFLDADVRLTGSDALSRLATFFDSLPAGSVLTGLPRFTGGGLLLVSQVPTAILTGLPWPLVGKVRSRALGALNGQVWMIDAGAYRLHRPHERHRNEVLEDVRIGRYLLEQGFTPVLADLRDTVSVRMYRNLGRAWLGFRKNAYLILSGRPVPFVLLWLLYGLAFVAAPLAWPLLYVSLYAQRFAADRFMRFPGWVPVAAPVSYLAASLMQADSFVNHLARRVTWKDRSVSG